VHRALALATLGLLATGCLSTPSRAPDSALERAHTFPVPPEDHGRIYVYRGAMPLRRCTFTLDAFTVYTAGAGPHMLTMECAGGDWGLQVTVAPGETYFVDATYNWTDIHLAGPERGRRDVLARDTLALPAE